MSYSVVWRPVADEQLADAWMAAADRNAVTAAAAAIDRALEHDPLGQGESRTGTTRILIERPLAALYEIVADDRQVFVLKVWLV
jgi:hypothetical protein